MARSLIAAPWPTRLLTCLPDSMLKIWICFGFSPATQTSGSPLTGSQAHARLLKECSPCTRCQLGLVRKNWPTYTVELEPAQHLKWWVCTKLWAAYEQLHTESVSVLSSLRL